MKPLYLACALSVLACATEAQRTSHGAQFTVVDSTTNARLSGVLLALSTVPEPKVTSEHGHATWNTGRDPNYVRCGTTFVIHARAEGFVPVSVSCDALPPSTCDAICVASYEVRLMPITAPRNLPPMLAPGETVPIDGHWEYDFVNYERTSCNDCPVVHCVDYLDGRSGGKIDYSGKNSKETKSKIEFDFKFGPKVKAILLGLCFDVKDDHTASKTETLDLSIGDKDFPGKCGRVCICRQELRFRYRRMWVDKNGRRDCGSEIVDVQVGYCISIELEDCPTKKI